MRFNVLTYNSGGLTRVEDRSYVRELVRSFTPKIDILCIQEHHLRAAHTALLSNQLWKDATFLIAPALDGVNAARNDEVLAGKGGLLTALSPSLTSLMSTHGFLPSGKGIWCIFSHPTFGRFGIIHIYAPNFSSERAALWSELFFVLDPDIPWSLLGDFNMVVNLRDHSGGNPHVVAGREKAAWNHLNQRLHIEDTFSWLPNRLHFSWTNSNFSRHVPGVLGDTNRVLKRLDRCYAPLPSASFQFEVNSKIIPGYVRSDHAPLLTTFESRNHVGRPSVFKFNTSLLKDERFMDKVTSIWTVEAADRATCGRDAAHSLQRCVLATKRLAITVGKERAVTRKLEEENLRKIVELAQLAIELNPSDLHAQLSLRAAAEDLVNFEDKKAVWMQGILLKKGILEADKGSKAFFSSFRAQSKACEIFSLEDENGMECTEWKDLEAISKEYFSKMFRARPPPSQEALDDVLKVHKEKISDTDRIALDLLPTIDELHAAAQALAQDRAPGPDGLPVQFLLAIWDLVGPLMLELLTAAMQLGILHGSITKGLIILLHKRGLLHLLTNKRPITLLNSIYKVFTKLFQIRTSPVCQKFVSSRQSAFLPGRSIHHTVLLVNELLHCAGLQEDEAHILLKLDMIKAFDTVDWIFLIALFRKLGFGENFIRFFMAITDSATSCISINGRLTTPVNISRSVRQGCPLSTLFFLIVMENLSQLLEEALATGAVLGIQLTEELLHMLHQLYADDVNLILKALLSNILSCQQVFNRFGLASGLYCGWEQTSAVLISSEPLPAELQHLQWKWETSNNTTKLLGFFIGHDISQELMENQLETILQSCIRKLKHLPLNLMARVTIINSILLGSLWYFITLWAGDERCLKVIEKQILQFLWDGVDGSVRHRVNARTIYLSKLDGGLGIICIQHQARALLGKFVLWAISDGSHPLQIILRRIFCKLAYDRWGTWDFSWVFNRCRALPSAASKVITNICKAWNFTKGFIVAKPPCNESEFLRLPLWTPSIAQINSKATLGKSCSGRKLQEAGLLKIYDIRHSTGRALTLAELDLLDLTGAAKRTFRNLCNNLELSFPVFNNDGVETTAFVGLEPCRENSLIWKITFPTSESRLTWREQERNFTILKGYHVSPLGLEPRLPFAEPPVDAELHRFLVGTFQTSRKHGVDFSVVGSAAGEFGMAGQFCWSDGTEIHISTAAQRRKLFTVKPATSHISLIKWKREIRGELNEKELWKTIWNKDRAAKHGGLLWQIAYRALATNCWRFPEARRNNPVTWCVRCEGNAAETIRHLFWECSDSFPIWEWANKIIQRAAGNNSDHNFVSWQQALLGTPLPRRWNCPQRWWDIIRGVVCWFIWTARCTRCMEGKITHPRCTETRIWNTLKSHLHIVWSRLNQKVTNQKLSLPEAIVCFHKDFGSDNIAFNIVAGKLRVADALPWDVH